MVQRSLTVCVTLAALLTIFFCCTPVRTEKTENTLQCNGNSANNEMNNIDWSGGGDEIKAYRFGDVFAAWFLQFWSWDELYCTYSTLFPNSLAHLYLAEVGEPKYARRNLTALLRVLDSKDEHEDYRRAKEDELVIHVRLGDVLTDPEYTDLDIPMEALWNQEEGFLNFDAQVKSNYNKAEFRELIGRIPKEHADKITKCVIVGGSHLTMQENESRNKEYIDLLTSFLQDSECEVSFYTSENPDKDLMFLASSHWFIGAMGGFAQIAAACVAARRGMEHAIFDYFNGEIASYNDGSLADNEYEIYSHSYVDWSRVDYDPTEFRNRYKTCTSA